MEEYRRRIADIESQIASQKSDEHVSFNISETVDTWTPSVNVIAGTDLELNNRLEEERRRFASTFLYSNITSIRRKAGSTQRK